jgi:two-component sensor histidine kinase
MKNLLLGIALAFLAAYLLVYSHNYINLKHNKEVFFSSYFIHPQASLGQENAELIKLTKPSSLLSKLELLNEVENKAAYPKHSNLLLNSFINQLRIQKATKFYNHNNLSAIVGGAGLLLSILVILYYRSCIQQSRKVLFQAQKQKLRSQQKEIKLKFNNMSKMLQEKDFQLHQKNKLLEEKEMMLIEKDWIFKEVHHRVKNNLQVLISLLNSQTATLKDQSALSAIQESQDRVQAMVLIHQKLYQSDNVSRINMPSYISDIVTYLQETYNLCQPIRVRLEVEPNELDVSQAVPLGLIINEAITNAFKHAFPKGRSGTVSLSLNCLEETTYQLTIKDDGIGLPVGYEPAHSRSLGMKLLHGFSRQLGGELLITSHLGMAISLVFAEEQISPISSHAAYA